MTVVYALLATALYLCLAIRWPNGGLDSAGDPSPSVTPADSSPPPALPGRRTGGGSL